MIVHQCFYGIKTGDGRSFVVAGSSSVHRVAINKCQFERIMCPFFFFDRNDIAVSVDIEDLIAFAISELCYIVVAAVHFKSKFLAKASNIGQRFLNAFSKRHLFSLCFRIKNRRDADYFLPCLQSFLFIGSNHLLEIRIVHFDRFSIFFHFLILLSEKQYHVR